MNRQYSETFVVRATDCDVQRRMRPAALFVAMQEGGERHAITLGAGYDAMMARGLFFALTRIHVRFCPRYHTFALEDGTPLASAGALWVMLDVNSRKIVSPSTVDLNFPDTSGIPSPIDLPTRLPHLGETTERFIRTPMYSDYDINGHVNNTRYIGFLCDALGHETLDGHYLGDLVAGYEKEIREPRPLSLSLSREGDRFTFLIASESGEKHFVAGGTLRKEE